jgi:4-amino-4-deoxy-L-arabinose transferase-like glycosyltransferase
MSNIKPTKERDFQNSNPKSQILALRPLFLWMMVALLAAAFAVRIYHLGVSDLTFDESASAFISGKPYPEMVRYLLTAFHELPPGYYVLLRAWEFVAGRGEFALRYPSVMLGVLGVALVYRIGRRGLGTGAGVVAALMLALQPFHFYYSQDARPYALMAVEAILMVCFFDRLCREPKLRWWLVLGVVGAFAMLTQYVMGFFVAALCVYLLLHARAHWRVVLVWFGGMVAVGAVMLIWLVTSRAGRLVTRTLGGITWNGFVRRLAPAQRMFTDVMFGSIAHPAAEWVALMAALILVGLLVSIFRPWRTLRPGGAWLLPTWLLVPPLLLIITPERLEARYNAAIVPAYCLALALVVTWLWQSKVTRSLAPVALGVMLYAQVTALIPMMNVVKSDYGHVVAYLNRHARPGDSLIFNGDWQWVQQSYYPAQANLPRYNLPPMTPPGLDPDQARPELEKALAASKRIWVLPAAVDEADPNRFVAGWLSEHAYLTSEYRELSLYYVGLSTTNPNQLNPPVTWDDVLQLESVHWTQSQAVPGEPLLLDLNWQVLSAPGRDLRIWVGLADRDGGTWFSTQIAPGLYYAPPLTWRAGQSITTRVGIPVPIGTPPGDFQVRVNVVGSRPSAGGDYVALTGAKVLPCSQTNPCPPLLAEDLTSLGATFGDSLKLVGYQVGGAEFTQGRFAAITLYWQAERSLADDVTERLALVDRSGHVVATTEEPPVAGWYPSSQWTPGQLLADPQVILVPPKLVPGDYAFRISLIASDGRALGNILDVGHIRVRARDRQFRAEPISHLLKVEFGDKVRLLGYDVKYQMSSLKSQTLNGEVKLTLYWQAVREMDENYTVFTHIVGADGKLAGQKDSWPHDGDYPTSFWMRGEVVKDEYVIPFEGGAGAYRIEVGLYDAAVVRLPAVANGARLANDAVIIPLSAER